MRYYFIVVCLIFSFPLNAQKVGLVLSGGGAKGLAHVGVLKALEENNIPIDYIVGTSMGGIIAGSYAAGMSPDQIEEIVLSDRFLKWINGDPETGYNYYYHKAHRDPSFLKLDLSLDSTLNVQLNTSLANDASLNFALAEQLAQASAISNNNFDSLFIPLRVVAADIFTQNEVILSNGSLSDALRATQTVPFFYTPIRVNGRYLFDGGVYNNFPVDVVKDEFHPDIIIGSNVSTKIFNDYPYDKDDKLISHSLIYMLLDKSDPTQLDGDGIYIQPDLKGYTSFDFRSAKSLIDSGYVQTLRQIEDIKNKIAARKSCENVMEARNRFNDKGKPFIFSGIDFHGFNEKQSRYIDRIFGINSAKPSHLYYSDVKRGYFQLVSDSYFNNVYPGITYDSSGRMFRLQLTRRPQKNFQVDFGGVLATRDISNIFMGLNLYNFNRLLTHMFLGFQTGNFFKSAQARSRFDFPASHQFFVEPSITFDSWDYLENNNLLQDEAPTVLRRINRKIAVDFGWPVSNRFKAVLGIEGFSNNDRYSNDRKFVSSDILDELKLRGFKTFFTVSANTLNRKQYANAGTALSLTGSYFNAEEFYAPGSTAISDVSAENSHQWFRFKFSGEQYFNRGFFRPGYLVEAVFSNQPVFENYFGTIINTPGFMPFQDSPTLILENYRSFTYLAGGLRNVFVLRSKLDLRLEGYLFKPLDYLYEDENQDAGKASDITKIYFTGSAGVVFHSPIGPVSLSVNYYDDEQNSLGLLLHAGFLLFDRHSLE